VIFPGIWNQQQPGTSNAPQQSTAIVTGVKDILRFTDVPAECGARAYAGQHAALNGFDRGMAPANPKAN